MLPQEMGVWAAAPRPQRDSPTEAAPMARRERGAGAPPAWRGVRVGGPRRDRGLGDHAWSGKTWKMPSPMKSSPPAARQMPVTRIIRGVTIADARRP